MCATLPSSLDVESRRPLYFLSLLSWLSLAMEVEHEQSRTPLQPCFPRLSHPTRSTATASALANLASPSSFRAAPRPCRRSSPSPAAVAEQLWAVASRARARGRPGHPLPSTGQDPEATATGAPAATVAAAVHAAVHMARWPRATSDQAVATHGSARTPLCSPPLHRRRRAPRRPESPFP
jgi:hypothetical protein